MTYPAVSQRFIDSVQSGVQGANHRVSGIVNIRLGVPIACAI